MLKLSSWNPSKKRVAKTLSDAESFFLLPKPIKTEDDKMNQTQWLQWEEDMVSVNKWKRKKGQSFIFFCHGFSVQMCKENCLRCVTSLKKRRLIIISNQLDSMIRLADNEENYEKEKRKKNVHYFSLLFLLKSFIFFCLFVSTILKLKVFLSLWLSHHLGEEGIAIYKPFN